MEMTKTCVGCLVTLPATQEFFYKKQNGMFGVRAFCKKCESEKQKKYREENPEKTRDYYKSNKEKINLSHKEYYKNNREKVLKRTGENYKKNPEAHNKLTRLWRENNKLKHNELMHRHFKENREYYTCKMAKYRASSKNATPVWADFDIISATYSMAKHISSITGIKMHVDHIVPITHKLVCGLHVHNNLRVISEHENKSKGNRFIPGRI